MHCPQSLEAGNCGELKNLRRTGSLPSPHFTSSFAKPCPVQNMTYRLYLDRLTEGENNSYKTLSP
jgi:hypothetical protein